MPDACNPAAGHEPSPIPNDRVDIQTLVMQDLVARRAAGIEKYGTALQSFNGRDALMDAYQEALDLARYLRQAIEERDERRNEMRRSLEVAEKAVAMVTGGLSTAALDRARQELSDARGRL